MQHIIIHCLNISVWRSAEDWPAAQGSVRFKAWSGEVFEVGGELEPEVIEDTCWVTTWYHLTLYPLVDVILDSHTFKGVALLVMFMLWTKKLSSGLQIKDGRWHQTHFVFYSLDPSLLPVVDIYNLPKPTPGSHYHLEVGPVCFLWGFSVSRLTMEGWIVTLRWHPCAGVEIGAVSSNPWKSNPSEYKPPSKKILLHSANLPLDCRHRGRKHREPGHRRAEEEPGSSCTNSFSYSKSFFMLFKKDLHMCARLEEKRLYATQSLWNITNWRETKAKLISGH